MESISPTEAVLRSDDLFASFFAASPVPSFIADLGAREIVRVNRSALDLLGLEERDVLGRPGTDFLTEPSEEQVSRVRGLWGDRAITIRNVRTASGDGTVEIDIFALGPENVVLVQATDLTGLLEAAATSARRIDELERKTAALESMATRLAHDLRSPMTVIAGFASTLRLHGERLDKATREELLDRMAASATALAGMTQSVLDDATKRDVEVAAGSREVEDLFQFIREVTDAERDAAGAEIRCSSDLERLPVSVAALSQPLVNLVTNSIKYREPTRSLVIDLRVSQVADTVVIEVQDNGKGLPDDPTGLFTAGIRGASAAGVSGTGLGLAFVRASVDVLSGTVTARPLALGASFEIRLPTVVADEEEKAEGLVDADAGFLPAQLEAILHALPVPTFIIDLDTRMVVRVNRAGVALIGEPAQRIVGRPGRDFLDDAQVANTLRASVLATADLRATDVDLRTAAGLRRVSITFSPVPDTVLVIAQVLPDPPGLA